MARYGMSRQTGKSSCEHMYESNSRPSGRAIGWHQNPLSADDSNSLKDLLCMLMSRFEPPTHSVYRAHSNRERAVQ